MNFGHALDLIKKSQKLTRLGWNGKDMYVRMYPPEKALDESTERYHSIMGFWAPRLEPFIFMKTGDDKYIPWLASQTDLLAEDWELYPVIVKAKDENA